MSIIIVENSENTPHTLKLGRELIQKYSETWKWNKIVISRCQRCLHIFMSETERKYCSKECQYNKRYKKDYESKGVEK